VKVKNCKPNIVPIEEDLEGLYNYFTTPTIRHKIIHPLFLLMKFFKATKVYYNKSIITEKPNTVQFFLTIQKKLYSNLFQFDADDIPLIERPFIVCLRSPESEQQNSKVDKISKFLSNLDTSASAYFNYLY